MQDSTPKTDARIEEQNADLQTQAMLAKKARAERIKKMRGWLSPRDSVADDLLPKMKPSITAAATPAGTDNIGSLSTSFFRSLICVMREGGLFLCGKNKPKKCKT